MKYLVDTNAFWEVIKEWNSPSNPQTILPLLKNGTYIEFYLPEICALEIYSVLGKHIRGKNNEINTCTRTIQVPTTTNAVCSNKWISNGIKKTPNREATKLQAIIKDILNNNISDFKITIIPLTDAIIRRGTILLHNYSTKYDFHSLDSIVAASVQDGMTVITHDRVLKNVLRDEGISIH